MNKYIAQHPHITTLQEKAFSLLSMGRNLTSGNKFILHFNEIALKCLYIFSILHKRKSVTHTGGLYLQ